MREEVASPSPLENGDPPQRKDRYGLVTPNFVPENRPNSLSEAISMCL